jgi:hypothetical protein
MVAVSIKTVATTTEKLVTTTATDRLRKAHFGGPFCLNDYRGLVFGMETNKTALERAFELAKSGKFASISEIKSALVAERYSTEKVTGATLNKQLRELIASSR